MDIVAEPETIALIAVILVPLLALKLLRRRRRRRRDVWEISAKVRPATRPNDHITKKSPTRTRVVPAPVGQDPTDWAAGSGSPSGAWGRVDMMERQSD